MGSILRFYRERAGKGNHPMSCQNPECGARLGPAKRGNKHCDHACLQRHLELLRGQCARPGCENWLPPKRCGIYCSRACYEFVVVVPRQQCAREGCTKKASRAHSRYCSVAHAQEAEQRARKEQPGFFKAMSVAGRDRRSTAVARSNKEKPRRRH